MVRGAASSRPESYLRLGEAIAELRAKDICYVCHDLATGEVFADQPVLYDDDRLRIVLETHPRAHGHAIVVWKPHRNDFTELAPDETAALFTACTAVANAIKRALGAENIYLATMCDGSPNHLHVQLLPRYPGEPIGSKRFVAPRQILSDGNDLAAAIRAELTL